MTTAFVLSGGGSLGAVHVGMLAALRERRIHPDLLVGTSVGALNAAFVAGRGFDAEAVEALAAVWQRVRRQHVFPFDPVRHTLALAGRRPSLCSPRALRTLVERHLSMGALEDARIPLHVVATDVLSGEEVLLSHGDATSAVTASAAIPGVFPSVERDGRTLMDGGVADHTAISQAAALGADRIVVLPTGYACALDRPPGTSLASATHAITLLIQQRLIADVARCAAEGPELVVLPPLCPLSVSSIDFRWAGLLIERAQHATAEWLDAGRHLATHPERFLALHHHALRRPSTHDPAPTDTPPGGAGSQGRVGSTCSTNSATRD